MPDQPRERRHDQDAVTVRARTRPHIDHRQRRRCEHDEHEQRNRDDRGNRCRGGQRSARVAGHRPAPARWPVRGRRRCDQCLRRRVMTASAPNAIAAKPRLEGSGSVRGGGSANRFRTLEGPVVRACGDPFDAARSETSMCGPASSCQRRGTDRLGSLVASVSVVVAGAVAATVEAQMHMVSATAVETPKDERMRSLTFVMGGAAVDIELCARDQRDGVHRDRPALDRGVTAFENVTERIKR